jgi:toxin FitB
MYLLDTNVLSEARKGKRAHASVISWFTSTPAELMWVSPVVIAELELGVHLLARKDEVQAATLRRWVDGVAEEFASRCVSIDIATAGIFAKLHVPDKRPERDAWIAASALQKGLTVVTRNVGDFAPMGVMIVDPWVTA